MFYLVFKTLQFVEKRNRKWKFPRYVSDEPLIQRHKVGNAQTFQLLHIVMTFVTPFISVMADSQNPLSVTVKRIDVISTSVVGANEIQRALSSPPSSLMSLMTSL
jgi:hypothetical protein